MISTQDQDMELQDQEKKKMMMSTSQDVVLVDDVEEEEEEEEEEEAALPGFRFHPTDEELVSFYLRRKVEKKPFSIDIIKQIDLYKYNPWDLPKVGSSVGEKEWYFYCKRGRKYRNSLRPNRVTGSGGFWKATGIDRPIHDSQCIIGLKKSLVYYRGSAGKGTKTDWMMHEFRLPPHPLSESPSNPPNIPYLAEAAEIWTLCRIFKRNRKYTPDWRDQPSSKKVSTSNPNNTPNLSKDDTKERYISFSNPISTQHHQQQVVQYDEHECIHGSSKLLMRQKEGKMMEDTNRVYSNSNTDPNNYYDIKGEWTASLPLMDQATPLEVASNFSSPLNPSTPAVDQVNRGDVGGYGGSYWWEDLSSLVDFAIGEIYS